MAAINIAVTERQDEKVDVVVSFLLSSLFHLIFDSYGGGLRPDPDAEAYCFPHPGRAVSLNVPLS